MLTSKDFLLNSSILNDVLHELIGFSLQLRKRGLNLVNVHTIYN